jgi:putative transposase
MKRRKWKPEQKALIVLEGLKGRPLGDLCAEHEISQAQYYQWRDQFLANAAKAFESAPRARAGSNARTPGSRTWSANSPWSSKKRGDPRVRRGPYAKVVKRNAQLLERIRDLKAEHPFWGYRRIWAYLRYVDGLIVNQKRIYGGMKAADLLVKPNLKLRARRKADTTKPRPTWPNQWWGIDMTKVMIEGFGWVYLVVVLDWHTKKVVGHYAGLQARAWHWLVALNRAVNQQFPDGVRDRAPNLMADNECQPTSLAFMRACAAMGIRQAFTSYSNPKGNADTERFLRTLKEELVARGDPLLHRSGSANGPARTSSSKPSTAGSSNTTTAISTRRWATAHPRHSKPNTSATSLP